MGPRAVVVRRHRAQCPRQTRFRRSRPAPPPEAS